MESLTTAVPPQPTNPPPPFSGKSVARGLGVGLGQGEEEDEDEGGTTSCVVVVSRRPVRVDKGPGVGAILVRLATRFGPSTKRGEGRVAGCAPVLEATVGPVDPR